MWKDLDEEFEEINFSVKPSYDLNQLNIINVSDDKLVSLKNIFQ